MNKLLFGVLAVLVSAASPVRADEAPARDKEMAALLEKAIKAAGGAKKLEKFQASTLKMKGKIFINDKPIEYTGEWAVYLPDRMRNEINVEAGGMTYTQIQVLNKGKGWVSAAGVTRAMDKETLEEARQEMHSGWVTQQLTPLRDKVYKLSPLGESKIGKHAVVGMLVTRKDYRDVNLYFDKKTSLLVKAESRIKDIAGGGKEVTEETFYDNFKEVQGMKVAHQVAMKRDGKDFLTGEVTEIDIAEKLDDSVFAKP